MIFNWYDTGGIEPYTGTLQDSNKRVMPIEEILQSLAVPAVGREEGPKPSQIVVRGNKKNENAAAVYKEIEGRRGPREEAIIARQIMSHPVHVLHPDMTIRDAWEFMKDHHILHAPVAIRDGSLVGILSKKDILTRTHPEFKEGVPYQGNSGDFVARIMSHPVLTATPESDLRIIARLFYEEGFGSMPIVNQGHLLEGIITTKDILQVIMNRPPLGLWL